MSSTGAFFSKKKCCCDAGERVGDSYAWLRTPPAPASPALGSGYSHHKANSAENVPGTTQESPSFVDANQDFAKLIGRIGF